MLELRDFRERKNIKEEVRLAQKLKRVLESLYDSTKYYNIIDHALAAYLLGREKEVLEELPDNPRNLREALATLFVASDSERALRAVEILEKRYKKRLISTLLYLVIALDILLDKKLFAVSKRLYDLLREVNIVSTILPGEDAYIAFAVFERAAQSLEVPLLSVRIEEEPETALRILVDFAIRRSRKELDFAEYQSVLSWISAQLKEELYSESFDDIESFSAEIPPLLFFSPARLYVVWKFLWKARKLEVALPSYVLDEKNRERLIEFLRKKKRNESLKLKALSLLEDFYLTVILTATTTLASLVVQSVFKLAIPLLNVIPIIAIITIILVNIAKKYAEKIMKKVKNKIPGFSSIKNKRKEIELRLRDIENSLERYMGI